MPNYIIPDQVKVRLVADLSACAFKSHQDKELALWHCLRALNTTGTGQISVERAIEGLRSVFGYSQRTVFRLLDTGCGLFWTRQRKRRGSVIKIKGIKNVCIMRFNTRLFNDIRMMEVPAEKFNTLKARRLALWASIAKPKHAKAHPISRASLENYTGVQRRQQQRYDSQPDRLVKKTAAFRPGCEQPRLPNIYHRKAAPGPRGMLVRVRRELKSLISEEAVETRRYFNSIKSIMRTKDRVDPCFLLMRSPERRIKGRLEYTQILTMVGV